MRLLKHKVKVGILWGREISLYYDNPSNDGLPQWVTTLKFHPDSKTGSELCGLLEKSSYSAQDIERFCLELIAHQHREKIIEKEIVYLTSNEGVAQVKNLLTPYLSKKGLDREAISAILKEITIERKGENKVELVEANPTIQETQVDIPIVFPNNPAPTKKKAKLPPAKFEIKRDGQSHIYNMGEYVAKIIKLYLDVHPNISFEELNMRFPKESMGCSGTFLSRQPKFTIKKDGKTTLRNTEVGKLKDGLSVYVTNQWTSQNGDTISYFHHFVEQYIAPNLGIKVKRLG
ncbi:MAG: hypothetical protein LIP03_02225 [Bacteroidales bacterium]|nr:hypothetical protein [Bacteroidales bacterium]